MIIIGGGGHGAAIAYNLAKYHGITNVAILEKSYLGGGNTARNTAVIRSNYLTEAGVKFYSESVKLFNNLSNEFNYNVMMENRGQLTLAHSDAAIRSFRWRAEVRCLWRQKLVGERFKKHTKNQHQKSKKICQKCAPKRYPEK